MGTSKGFWSYVHKDNEDTHGAIRRIAQHVEAEYEVLTGGDELDLFLDNMRLKWGDKWKDAIRAAIESSTFFIPIVTPRYFKSDECRNELLGFAEEARALDREALIMPLYFVEVPELEAGNSADPMIQLIADSQMKDWRTLRLLDETTQPYRLALNELGTRLQELSRKPEGTNTAQENHTPAERAAEERPPAETSRTSSEPEQQDRPRGSLELLAEGEDALPRIGATLTAIPPEIEQVGDLATAAAREVETSDAKGGGFKGRLVVANRLAKRLEERADNLEKLTSDYAADLIIFDPAIREMIRMAASNEDPVDANQFYESVEGMIEGSEKAAEGIGSMIDSMDAPAKLSRELEVPLNRLRVALQSLIDSNERMADWKYDISTARANLDGGS
jgi:hypothetical protein